MPRGPKGEKRPADVIGNAVKVMRIATGEEDEDYGEQPVGCRRAGPQGRTEARREHEPGFWPPAAAHERLSALSP